MPTLQHENGHKVGWDRVYYDAVERPEEVWAQHSNGSCRWRQTGSELKVIALKVTTALPPVVALKVTAALSAVIALKVTIATWHCPLGDSCCHLSLATARGALVVEMVSNDVGALNPVSKPTTSKCGG